MGYATVADIKELNTARTFGASTKPTEDQVVDFIEQTAAVLDGILRSKGYTIPVPTSATGALKALEHYNALGGHCLVEKGAPTSDRRDSACSMWANAQKMLKDGVVELDIPRDSTTAYPRSAGAATPHFSRCMEF